MSLNDSVRSPISSRVVTGSVMSKLPAAIALVPCASLSIGLVKNDGEAHGAANTAQHHKPGNPERVFARIGDGLANRSVAES